MKDKRETTAKIGFIVIFAIIIIAILIPLLGAMGAESKEKKETGTASEKANEPVAGSGVVPASEPAAAGGDTTEKVKATFVELGSVKCIPCKMMQPIMKEIEEEYAGQVKVVFHDVWTEEGKPYAATYSIRVIPTQVFLDADGKEYFRHEGFFPKDELVKILKKQGVK